MGKVLYVMRGGGAQTKHSATKEFESSPEAASPGGVQISVY